MTDTNIPVTDAVWQYLNAQKGRNESFDDVLRDELNLTEQDGPAHATHD